MFQALLVKIAEMLESIGLVYMVVGGQAVLLYSEPRLTKDIAITLGAGPEHLAGLLEAIQSAGWSTRIDKPDLK